VLKDFVHYRDKRDQNLTETERLSSKNLSKLYCQILIKFLWKLDINFVHFAWKKVNDIKPRVHIMLKRALFHLTMQSEEIFYEISRQFSWKRQYSTEFSNILLSFIAFYSHKWNSTVLNVIRCQFHSLPWFLSFNFATFDTFKLFQNYLISD